MNELEIRNWLTTRIAALTGVDAALVDPRDAFDAHGLSSTDAVVLSGELEELLGCELSPTLVYDHPTIAAVAEHLGATSTLQVSGDEGATGAGGHPIAIVGIACRFPGATGPQSYWHMLMHGVDMIREVPADRWDVAAYYHPDASAPGRSITRWGGFLDAVDRFDPFFFGISPGEAERMDPQQRLLLELAWEAFDDSGLTTPRLAGSPTGVFVGVSINEYGFLQHGRDDLINGHSATGNALSIAANRISYFFDLRGPSLAVDTACSSSLAAVHLACRSLRDGECELAVAGGVNIVLSPAHSIAFTKAGVVARDGRCKVFDARADGYVRGEGGGLVVLKPLARALADGDIVHAVIRGSAMRQDGRTNGLMAPNREAQEAVLRAAYRDARVDPARVQYVEAHGTGTLLGDAMEAMALGAIVGASRAGGPCAIGSVKSNFGHLEAAAGIAGLLKVTLALRHGAIPPMLHFEQPNPYVHLAELGLRVAETLSPWPDSGEPLRAGVSSFGFGGTNVHVVVEQAPPQLRADEPAMLLSAKAQLLPISAHDEQALRDVAQSFHTLLSATSADQMSSLEALCAAASLRRTHLDSRMAIAATSIEELTAALERHLRGKSDRSVSVGRRSAAEPGRIVFVFPGQGSQWHGMGRELSRDEPVFRAALERCDDALQRHAPWSVLHVLGADASGEQLSAIEIVQPVLFAMQVALAELWRSWGIEPDAVVGHSMGEVAAAYIAGALSLDDAARVITTRSVLLARLRGRGGMALVGLSAEETLRRLEGAADVCIAAVNGPQSTVVAGDSTTLGALLARLERHGVYCAAVAVDVPAHGPATALLGDELRSCLAGLAPRKPDIRFVSTAGTAGEEQLLDADYWVRNLTNRVAFMSAVHTLAETRHDTFLEISPHPVLQSSVQQTLLSAGRTGMALGSLRRGEAERVALLSTLGALYTTGRNPAWQRLHAAPARAVALPPYPWRRERFWIDARTDRRRRGVEGEHPFLGERLDLAREPDAYTWQNEIDATSLSFLRDHRVNGTALIPGSVFVDAALAAGAAAGLTQSHTLANIVFERSLAAEQGRPRVVQVALTQAPNGEWSYVAFSREQDGDAGARPWTRHCSATFLPDVGDIAAASDVGDAVCAQRGGGELLTPDEFYAAMTRHGADYGPALRCLREIRRGDGVAVGRIVLPKWLHHEHVRYQIHPALLDAALQLIAAAARADRLPADGSSWLLSGCDSVTLRAAPGGELWSHVKLRSEPDVVGNITADVRLFDTHAREIGLLSGVRVVRIAPPRPVRECDDETWSYTIGWRRVAWAEPGRQSVEARSSWIIFADRAGIGDALAKRLEARGHHCCLVRCPAGDDPTGTGLNELLDGALPLERTTVRGVIHLWAADHVADALSVDSLAVVQTWGCHAAVLLVHKLVARHTMLGMPRLWLVTRGAQPVQDDARVAVEQATLWGLARSIGFEAPELRCTTVDLDAAATIDTAADMLVRQLAAADDEGQVALRGQARFVPRLMPRRATAATGCDTTGVPWRSDRVYLITGGLGGLGLAVAAWLVEQGARHIALLGRHAPSQQAARVIDTLRGAGAVVTVVAADVADEAALRSALHSLRKAAPPIAGVVHAAGVLDNAPIVALDRDRLMRVLAPKVAGAWNLHVATCDDPLDFFILFSSAVSVLGSPGQGNYAAANAFLDGLAHFRRASGLPALSVNWGPWADTGLVAGGSGIGAHAGQGVKAIRPAAAFSVLSGALRDGDTQLTVLPFDLKSLLELYPAAASVPFFAEVGGTETHVARLYARPRLQQDYVAPRNEIERTLAELWRQTLRIDRVGVRDSFFELGGDSVLAAQLVTAAHRTFGVGIDLREAFESFTIESIATRIEAALIAKIDQLSESEVERLLQN